MSENTIKTQKVVPLPDQQRVAVTLDTLDELEHSVEFLQLMLKKYNDELRAIKSKLNKLRLVLEAK